MTWIPARISEGSISGLCVSHYEVYEGQFDKVTLTLTPSFSLNSRVRDITGSPQTACKGPLITFYPDKAANLAECFLSLSSYLIYTTQTRPLLLDTVLTTLTHRPTKRLDAVKYVMTSELPTLKQ